MDFKFRKLKSHVGRIELQFFVPKLNPLAGRNWSRCSPSHLIRAAGHAPGKYVHVAPSAKTHPARKGLRLHRRSDLLSPKNGLTKSPFF
jgi:hypothetical protein